MNTPKLRFSQFTDSWNLDKLIDKVSLYSGLTYTPDDVRSDGTLVLRSSNVQNGEISLLDNVYVNPSVAKSQNVEVGDIIVVVRNGSRALIGKHAQIRSSMLNTVIGAFMTGIRSGYPSFMNALLSSGRFGQEVEKNLGATINQITNATFNSMEFFYPKDEEQIAIGDFFKSLDLMITLTSKKIEKLKQTLAGCMQTMFPQEGELEPKVRFKGFDGEWKKAPFGDILAFLSNNTLSRAELNTKNGEIMNIHYGDVLIKYGNYLDAASVQIPFVNCASQIKSNSDTLLQDGDVIIADTAEDEAVGKCTEIINIESKYVVSGLHTIPCRPKKTFGSLFLGYYMNSESYRKQLLPLMQGVKVISISKYAIKNTIIQYPSVTEQSLIGSFFRSLDEKISLESKRLEKLKFIKSACLDNMFV